MALFGPPNIEKLRNKGNVNKLIKIATAGAGDIQAEAAKALVDVGHPAVEPLVSIKENLKEKGQIAVAILTAMGEEAVESLLAILEGVSPSANGGRFLAVQALGKIGAPQAKEAVLEAIDDEDFFVSSRAMTAAGRLAGTEAQAPVLKSLRKNADTVHGQMTENAAVQTLGAVGDAKAIPEIMKLIARGNPEMSRSNTIANAALSLGKIVARENDSVSNPEISSMLAELVSDNTGQSAWDSPLICASAALALGEIIDNNAGQPLLKALRSENPAVRSSAAYGLRGTMGTDKIGPLVSALEDENPTVRANAVESLGISSNDEVIPHLIECLHDTDPAVREKTVQALGFFNDKFVVDSLISALDDSIAAIRMSAVMSLGLIGSNRALAALKSRLKKEQDIAVIEVIEVTLEVNDELSEKNL